MAYQHIALFIAQITKFFRMLRFTVHVLQAKNMCRRRLSVQPSSYNIAKKQNDNLRICTTLGRYFEFEL